MTGDSHRSSSSTTLGIDCGAATSCARSPGCSARCAKKQSSDAETVSRPAVRKRKQMERPDDAVFHGEKGRQLFERQSEQREEHL
jgi:hypothetical protein